MDHKNGYYSKILEVKKIFSEWEIPFFNAGTAVYSSGPFLLGNR
jgi:hypothetical protein